LIRDKRECLVQLRELGRRQLELIDGGDITGLLDMLAAKPHGIASAKARIKEHIQPNPLPRSSGPSRLIRGDMFLGPRREALATFADVLRLRFVA